MSTKRVWNSGPPPHVGWWNASATESDRYWRWWDGVRWSKPAISTDHPRIVAVLAKTKSDIRDPSIIKWTRHWPKNARVARVNPLTGEVTGKGPLS